MLAILLLQFEFVTHDHNEHEEPLEVGSHCEVCLKLDKNGNVPLAQMPSHEIPVAGSIALPVWTSSQWDTEGYLLPSRGPPAS